MKYQNKFLEVGINAILKAQQKIHKAQTSVFEDILFVFIFRVAVRIRR